MYQQYPSTTVKASVIIRPPKVVCIACELISTVLLIVAIASPAWLETKGYRQGLWEECHWSVGIEAKDANHSCFINALSGWLLYCGLLTVAALFFNLLSVMLTGLAMGSTRVHIKTNLYIAALSLLVFALVFLAASLVVFPIMFLREMDSRQSSRGGGGGVRIWYFEWSYGVAWASFVFNAGALFLLCFDRNADEIVYKEQIVYATQRRLL